MASDSTQPLLLDMPFELLSLASSYVDAAYSLVPRLARRPDAFATATPRDLHLAEQAADLLATYRRYIYAAIVCLRKVIASQTAQTGDGRVQLRAMGMLAELLVRETCGSEEAEQLITRGLSTASKHASFAPYRPLFVRLQIEMACKAGNLKPAKAACRKALQDVYGSDSVATMQKYDTLLLLAGIAETLEQDDLGAVSALREILSLARANSHFQIEWMAKLQLARLAIIRNDAPLSRHLMQDLGQSAGCRLPLLDAELTTLETAASSTEARGRVDTFALVPKAGSASTPPQRLVEHLLVLQSIWLLQTGQPRAAKFTLKALHGLLDQGLEGGQASAPQVDCVQTTQAGDEASQADTAIGNVVLHLHVMPYPAFYAYVFLLSTVVQMDPIGASKCLSFATAGLESLYSRSSGSDPASFTSISGAGRVTSQILRMIDMLADLLAYQCELFLMRSRLEQADRILSDLTSITRSHGIWDAWAPRITHLRGAWYHALGRLEEAEKCYVVATRLSAPASHLNIVAQASTVLVCAAKAADKRENPTDGTMDIDVDGVNAHGDSKELDEDFLKRTLEDCSKAGEELRMLGLIVDALVNKEITKAKACLASALQISTAIGQHYMKPLILALLSCYFLHTRNEQAIKMLHSAHKICRSLGGAEHDKKDKITGQRTIGKESVGLAPLGIWTGDQLLAIYESTGDRERSTRQEAHNNAHRQVLLEQQTLLGDSQ